MQGGRVEDIMPPELVRFLSEISDRRCRSAADCRRASTAVAARMPPRIWKTRPAECRAVAPEPAARPVKPMDRNFIFIDRFDAPQ